MEETRQLDSVYFRKLQALHQESVSKKDEVRGAPTSKNKLIFYQRGLTLYVSGMKRLTATDVGDIHSSILKAIIFLK